MSFLRKRILRAAILAAVFLLCALRSGAEEEITVKLKADSLRYDEENNVVVASGSVEARLRDLVVVADTMLVNTSQNMFTAEGNVNLSTDSYSAMSDNLTYNASTEIASVRGFYTIYTTPDIQGNVYIKVEEFMDDPVHKWGRESVMTTCDYIDAPHYDIKAKLFEFYPNDKMIGYSVTFYINGIPVMWFPYWIYSFHRRRSSLMPVVGHNQVEGNFAKFAFDYFIDNDAYGLVYIDLMQKKGLGKGFEHEYKMGDRNSGVFYLYHLEERDTGLTDWVSKLDHNIKLDEVTKLSLFNSYSNIYLVPSGRLDQSYGKIALDHLSDRKFSTSFDILDDRWGGHEKYNYKLSHSISGYDTSFNASLDRGKSLPRWNRFSSRLTHKQPLLEDIKENLTFSTVVNFYRNSASESDPADERLEPQVELVDKEEEYTLKVFQNWYIDTDRDTYLGDANIEYLEKQPEITLSLRQRDLNLFKLDTSFGFGQYHEVRWLGQTSSLRDYTSERYSARLTATRSESIGFGTRLSLLGGVEQFLYTPGDERYVLNEEIGLSTDLWNFFSNSIEYKRGISEGNTPFFFDIVGVNHEWITEKLTLYYRDYVRWTTSCGYNFKSELYNDLLTTLTVKPHPRLDGSASTGYDINNEIYRDLVLRTTVRPIDGVSWTWDSVHDLNQSLFKSAGSLVRAELFKDNWRYNFFLEFRHSYDYFVGKFILRDLSFVKNLHCWEMRFTYSDWRKEWRVSFTLNAFPSQPVGWGAGERGYFFEGYSPDRFLNQFRQSSPGRY